MSKPNYNNSKLTPYEKAYLEWSNRIGEARVQLKAWRVVALLSMLLALLLLAVLVIVASRQKNYVYVAEVGANQSIVSKVLLPQPLSPTQAEKSYFIGTFISNIMGLPLDPVIARQNWFDAYAMAQGQALTQLTTYAKQANPFGELGAETKSVQINNVEALSDNSIEANWTTSTYDSQGNVTEQSSFDGVFTLAQGTPPATTQGLLKNPFGLKITYFTINQEGS